MHRFRSPRVALAALAVVVGVLGACGDEDGADIPSPVVDGSEQASAAEEEPQPTQEPADESDPAVDPEPQPTPAPPSEPVALHATPPEPTDLVLSPDEMLPNAKRLASEVVQALLTYDVDDDASTILERVSGDGADVELLTVADPVLHADAWSRGEIVYPQLGGFNERAASVMVVARQTVGRADGSVTEETRTFDVRLAIQDGAWQFHEFASTGGVAVPRPDDLSEAAIAVLEDERIELPDTARWDIHRGAAQETLLKLMLLIADRTEYGVIVLDTGHPWEVFGTDRQSRHSMGRAVDLYRLGGPDVIDDREDGSDLHGFVEWLYDQPEMTNLGSPWALDGFRGRSFTDSLHQDHLHIEAGSDEDAKD